MNIKQAAILYRGIIYTGKRHHNIITEMVNVHGIEPPISTLNQGFVTDEGKFVSRKEAAEIAFKAGQISKQRERLYSEDLY